MKKLAFLPLVLLGSAFAQGDISVDGSSTVYPITLAMAEEFQVVDPDTRVVVAFSGTGGGFERFCAGATQVSNASRVISEDEIALCEENGVEFIELPVAADALTVVVNPENDWVQCLTVEQLNQIWGPDSTVQTWADVNPEWPDEQIELYGAGTDSGTFDYFTEAVNGEGGAIRTDFFPS
jgi:phosphate transport system substrate-binding protein